MQSSVITTNSEMWRAIPGYQGLYEISNIGRVRRTKSRRLLTPFVQDSNDGSLAIDLRQDGRRRRHFLATLVATVWIGPGPIGTVATHRSHDVRDNRASNLEWLTPTQSSARWFQRRGYRPRSQDGTFRRDAA